MKLIREIKDIEWNKTRYEYMVFDDVIFLVPKLEKPIYLIDDSICLKESNDGNCRFVYRDNINKEEEK